METSVRKIYPLTGEKTVSNRVTLDLIPFTANNRKALNVTRVSRAGDMSVNYRAFTPITDFEAKTSLTLAKMCLDADAHKGDGTVKIIDEYGPFVNVAVDLRDMTKFITGRTTREQRKKVYTSLDKVAGMVIKITIPPQMPDMIEERATTKWIHGIATEDDFETAQLWISKSMLRIAADEGISYNLKTAVQKFSGRAMLLYLHLQSWKYKTRNGKYGYQHQIKHKSVFQALDLKELKSEKEQMRATRTAFRTLKDAGVCNFIYDKRSNEWKKKVLH